MRRYPKREQRRRPASRLLDGRTVFGMNLRRLRKEKGLSQEALAERAGLHWTYVGSVERAERNVSIDNICRLAKAVETDVWEMLKPPKTG